MYTFYIKIVIVPVIEKTNYQKLFEDFSKNIEILKATQHLNLNCKEFNL